MTRGRRVIMATGGSLGDLHPFLAVGKRLQRLGLDVDVATSADYRLKVEAEGLGFREVGTSVAKLEAALGMDRKAITTAVMRSNRFLFERIVLPSVEEATRAMIAASETADVIVGHSFAVGARIAAERLRLPYVPVALQPMTVFSAYDPPFLPLAPWLRPASGGASLALNQSTLATLRLGSSGWTRTLNRIRHRLGAGPSPGDMIFDALRHSPLALGLYSPLLSALQPDAPPNFHVIGHPAYDSENAGPPALTASLEAFLNAGDAPLVFTLGSAVVQVPGDFYTESVKAARRLARRAVMLVGPEGDLSVGGESADIHVARYAPFSLLFPRAAAIVHQGGVGTTHQALQSGRPQLVVPHLGDQHDNAARVVRLGCAAILARSAYRSAAIAQKLEALLQSPALMSRAKSLAEMAREEDGAGAAAELIAGMVRNAI